MRGVICHNCSGFGVTVAPVMGSMYDDRDPAVAPAERSTDQTVYPCQCCGGAGYLHVVAPT